MGKAQETTHKNICKKLEKDRNIFLKPDQDLLMTHSTEWEATGTDLSEISAGLEKNSTLLPSQYY